MTITGEQIIAFRKDHKLSRQALAEKTGLTPAAIANLEGNPAKGKPGRKFKKDEEHRLAAVMGVQLDGGTIDDALAFFGAVTAPAGVSTPPPSEYEQQFDAALTSDLSDEEVIINLDEDEDEEIEPLAVTGAEALVIPFPSATVNEPPAAVVPVTPQPAADAVPVQVTLPSGRLVSNSETATFQRCQRKWWLAWHRHLKLRQERPGGARAIGTWVHAALACHYVPQGTTPQDPREALEQVLGKVYGEVTSMLSHLGEQGEFIDDTILANFQKDAELARAMVEGYVQWIAETGADEGLVVIGPEQIVHTEIFPGVFLIAKIDVRVHRQLDDAVLFLDHKTVGDLTRPVRTIHMNPQMLRYDVIERAQPGAPQVDGALYNMLRKVKRTERAQPPFYQRVEVRHNPHELDNHLTHTKSTVQRILAAEAALAISNTDHHRIVPPTPDADCAFMCDFFAVCNMLDDGSRAEDFLSQYFEEVQHLDYYVLDTLEQEKV